MGKTDVVVEYKRITLSDGQVLRMPLRWVKVNKSKLPQQDTPKTVSQDKSSKNATEGEEQ